jgi:hypothetical protein
VKASFVAFYLAWAERQHWTVPDCHVRACVWLEQTTAPERLFMAFRGFSKSTIYGTYKAWCIYVDPTGVHQVWAADGKLAGKMSRYTRYVLLTHPWCAGILSPNSPTAEFFATGAPDLRNPTMQANSILGNSTGSRATAIDFDDIEVPKNIRTPELRERLRERIDESTHILVPGGRKTFVGTPHAHLTIYQEVEERGAAVLKIPLFDKIKRYESTDTRTRFSIGFPAQADGYWVMAGIGRGARVLIDGRDYRVDGDEIVFDRPPGVLVDIATGNAWPHRFDRKDIAQRRQTCRTINSWDSQYSLQAKPIRETRLDPDKLLMYDVEPVIGSRNGHVVVTLGQVQLQGFAARWDVSLGKAKSDASAVCFVLTDMSGRLYWHRALALTGDLEELSPVDGALIGGQVRQLLDACIECNVHHVVVETNGPGGFVPAIARKWAAPLGITIEEDFAITRKNDRILDAFEAPLSSRFLYAHRQVFESDAIAQMQQWDPGVKDQPDDYLDAAAGAIAATPVRVERAVGLAADPLDHWNEGDGQYEVELEYESLS